MLHIYPIFECKTCFFYIKLGQIKFYNELYKTKTNNSSRHWCPESVNYKSLYSLRIFHNFVSYNLLQPWWLKLVENEEWLNGLTIYSYTTPLAICAWWTTQTINNLKPILFFYIVWTSVLVSRALLVIYITYL